jgi:hypothetical protein
MCFYQSWYLFAYRYKVSKNYWVLTCILFIQWHDGRRPEQWKKWGLPLLGNGAVNKFQHRPSWVRLPTGIAPEGLPGSRSAKTREWRRRCYNFRLITQLACDDSLQAKGQIWDKQRLVTTDRGASVTIRGNRPHFEGSFRKTDSKLGVRRRYHSWDRPGTWLHASTWCIPGYEALRVTTGRLELRSGSLGHYRVRPPIQGVAKYQGLGVIQ